MSRVPVKVKVVVFCPACCLSLLSWNCHSQPGLKGASLPLSVWGSELPADTTCKRGGEDGGSVWDQRLEWKIQTVEMTSQGSLGFFKGLPFWKTKNLFLSLGSGLFAQKSMDPAFDFARTRPTP